MFHLKRPRPAQNLVPYVKSRPDSETGIAGGGLNINLLKGSIGKNLAVGHAIKRHPSRQTEFFHAVESMKLVEHGKHGVFQPRLH